MDTLNLIHNTQRVALVNNETGVVENLIVVIRNEDIPPDGYSFADLETIEIPVNSEIAALENIIKEIDPEFEVTKPIISERPLNIGTTKWSKDRGFYEE